MQANPAHVDALRLLGIVRYNQATHLASNRDGSTDDGEAETRRECSVDSDIFEAARRENCNANRYRLGRNPDTKMWKAAKQHEQVEAAIATKITFDPYSSANHSR